MKNLILACSLCSALLTSPAFASETGHDHPHGEQPAKLQLDAGKQWQTDAPLRQSMAGLRQSFADTLDAIHTDQLTLAGYNALAKDVDSAVVRIVAQCKLPPAADAQLHVVVAELMAGAKLMADPADAGTARSGAVRVVKALNSYGQYFNDPDFKALGH